MPVAVVIPVKGFVDAKSRLASVLTNEERATLTRTMLRGLLDVTQSAQQIVVTSDPEIAELAAARGATVVSDPGHGLNAAAHLGAMAARLSGATWTIVVHADLAFPEAISPHMKPGEPGEVLVVPDRHGRGTNLLGLPSQTEFSFSFGTDSFVKHVELAEAAGMSVAVAGDSPLAWDVDTPEDLHPPASFGPPIWSRDDDS